MVVFRLPFPPSVNHYWRSTVARGKGGRSFSNTYISERGKAYRLEVRQAIARQFGCDLIPCVCRLRVVIEAVAPDRRSRDVDNFFKAPLDALTHAGVWVDDSQIDRLEVIRGHVEKPGWLEVRLTEIDQ